MPNLWDWLLGGQQPPVFPQGQQPQAPFNPQQMAIAPTFAQAPQMAQDIAQGIAQPLLNAGNYLGGIMQGSQQFSWPETIQHGAALAMAMAPGPKGERVAGALERGLAGAAETAAPTGIRAYHGSPYDFNQFDLSKIGTGEGAQAYGHGLYFAEKEGTAKAYRDALKERSFQSKEGPVPYGQVFSDIQDAAQKAGNLHPDQSYQLAKTITDKIERGAPLDDLQYPVKRFDDAYMAGIAHAQERGFAPNPGKMYEVNIKAQPEQFLDWDKPLSQQQLKMLPNTESVNVLKDYLKQSGKELTGADLYRALGSNDAAVNALREAGIPGIRYLDQGSRAAGEGSRNYVVFNDQLIDILKKYGLAGMLGAGAAAPYFPQQPQQQ